MSVREQHTEDRLAPPRSASLPHEVMALLPDHWPAELPLARVTTCGPSVSITVLHQLTPTPVYGPPDPAVLAGGYASTAQLLLAVLASRPHGAASKDWLSEALITRRSVLAKKDDPEERVPLQRVENPVSVLRHLLVPPVLRALPTLAKVRLQLVSFYRSTRESGCGYRLAGMPLIWVDVVAIEESINRAHALEQFGSDAQREWEAAYDLLMQGEFLERESYSDWAVWRRQEQERQRWECVHALQGYYRKQGEPGEREATRILQRYWQSHMSNEDAFRPLVELLGKQECYGQAEEAYTHLSQAVEEEGRDLDRRTQEVMMWLRALHIQRKKVLPEVTKQSLASEASLKLERESDIRVDRRNALKDLVAITGTTFLFPQDLLDNQLLSPGPFDSEILSPLKKLTDACWQLSQASELRDVEQILPVILPKAKTFAHHSSAHQPIAATIASQAYRLAGLVALHYDNLPLREFYCKNAVQYGHIAGDADALVTALMSLATTFFYTKHPRKALQTYQETLLYLEKVSPVIRDRIYIGLAEAHARCGQEQEALQYRGLAYETSLEYPEEDPAFLMADYGSFLLYEGLTYLRLGQPQNALDVFSLSKVSTRKYCIPERIRVEIVNMQAEAALALNEQERFCTCLESGVKGATALKSEKRFLEAQTIYEKGVAVWGYDPRVKGLADLFLR